ncbi:MAG: hypothetical protein C0403_04770 [Desulfobacterium sp.]|nr:hypothetical protein [Desulfobacterium sp.]
MTGHLYLYLEKKLTLLAVLFFLTISLILCPWINPVKATQKPLASVNDVELNESDLEDALNEIMPAAIFHGGFSSVKRAKYRPQAFEKMIDKELLHQEARKLGLKADEAFIQSNRDKAVQRLGGEEQYAEALKKADLSEKQYYRILEKKNLIQHITKAEITDKAKVSDQEIKAHYEKNKSKFFRPKAVHLRQILISVEPTASPEKVAEKRRKAQEVYGKIKAGEDMAKLAWDYSNDSYRVKGGDYGLVHQGRLDPELESRIMQLEIGQLSEIFSTRFGFHIARVEAVVPPTQLLLNDVREKIKKELTTGNEERLRETLLQRLRSEARIIRF